VLAIGLTGGIGAGKSMVADLLVEKGAVLLDADRIAREVVTPGGPAYQPMVDRFGPGILDADGTIDRPAVAAIVFGDPEALADLNAITHPAIGVAMIQRKDEFADTDHIVVLDIPLLKPIHRETLSLAAVVVVDTPVDIAAQIDRQTRLDGADLVIDNSGDEQQLAGEVDRVWGELEKLRSRLRG
jgi:dephospho-CoA kinase